MFRPCDGRAPAVFALPVVAVRGRTRAISTPPGQLTDAARLWLRLRRSEGVTRARMAALIAQFGGPEAVFAAPAAQLERVAGMRPECARAILEGRLSVDLAQEEDLIGRYGARLVTLADEDYPVNLRAMPTPPPLLYYMGDLQETDRFAVAIVGTRHCTGYGRAVAEEIAGGMADAGVTVVSGLALGIDSAAHAGAARRGGRNLAVMGCGLQRVYPPENEQLAWQITQAGAVMSEYAMAAPPDKYNFPERNVILAGLALGVVVVEAPPRSGALLTASDALTLGREVFAVPADVTRAASQGANQLIREGATLVTRASDVLADLAPVLSDLLKSARPAGAGAGEEAVIVDGAPVNRKLDGLSREEWLTWDTVREEARHFDALFERLRERGLDLDVSALSVMLLQLEMRGLIRQAPGKIFMVAPAGIS